MSKKKKRKKEALVTHTICDFTSGKQTNSKTIHTVVHNGSHDIDSDSKGGNFRMSKKEVE
jgi:hypothetical protein